jgi:hypothetical protein
LTEPLSSKPIVERLQRCIDNCEETTLDQDALAHILEQDNEIERLTEELDTHLKVHLGVVRENVRLRAALNDIDGMAEAGRKAAPFQPHGRNLEGDFSMILMRVARTFGSADETAASQKPCELSWARTGMSDGDVWRCKHKAGHRGQCELVRSENGEAGAK